jgi:hypothetical protein
MSTLRDLDPLPLADRQLPDERVRVHQQAVTFGGRLDMPAQLAAVQPGPPQRQRECDVLGHGERRDQSHVLEHHADTGRAGDGWRVDLLRLAVDPQLSCYWAVDAVDQLHQRALAGAVLAEHGMDLAGSDVEVDGVIGHDLAEPAGQTSYGQKWGRFGNLDGVVGCGRHAHGASLLPRGTLCPCSYTQ